MSAPPDPSSHPAFAPLNYASIYTPCGSKLSCWHTKSSEVKKDKPVMLILHGYPQSSFMWRHVLPSFTEKFNVFVADLPGYGLSTPSTQDSSRHTIGYSVLHALTQIYTSEVDVVLLGHDRGARTIHRLCVTTASEYPSLHILAAIMIDIVPYKVQWEAFANPRAAIGYFHWMYLPMASLSIPMIMAYGGAKFCKELFKISCGSGEKGRERLYADDAVEHYAAYFAREETNKAAAEDYIAGASKDFEAQVEDQSADRKVKVPSLVIFAEEKLGKMHDVPEAWKEWVAPGTRLEVRGVGGGCGHYIPEEAPEEVVKLVMSFLGM